MKVLTNNQYYSQIANIIREQNGTNNTYKPQQIVNALKDLFYEEVEGVPPLNFQGIGEDLLDYRIDGASGGVGERTKNFIQNTATTQTKNGVTFTVNEDKSISCNGTATGNAFFKIGDIQLNKNCIMSGCPEGGDNNSYIMRLYNNGSVFKTDSGTGVLINSEVQNGYVEIRIAEGYTCNNLTFYPMIRPASIEDTSYEPYGYKVPVVMNGKNFLNNVASTGTFQGVKFTINEDKSITLNGTASNNAWFTVQFNNVLDVGQYILTGAVNNTVLRYQKNSTGYAYDDTGAGRNINITQKITSGLISLKITENVFYDNITIYPMMRLATIEDDTYEPYIEPTTTNIYLDEPIEARANIPSEYEEVEYIESTGTQYIDTNYTPVQGDDLEFKNVTINTFNGVLFSAGIESYQLILLGLGSVCYYKYFQTGNAAASSFSTITNGNIKVLNGNLYINNVLKAQADYGGAVNTTLNIFQRANNTSNLIGKIGEIIISNNGIIKRDFIPCYRKSDNVAGLYDLVNNTFYTNQGTGNFIVGPIKENESISLSDTNVNIPTIKGTNVLTVDTTVQPSKVYVKARKESSHEAQIRQLYESVNAELTQYKAQYGELGGE